MPNKRKWFLITIFTLILFSSGIFITLKNMGENPNNDSANLQSDSAMEGGSTLDSFPLIGVEHGGEKNKYYVVYIKLKGGGASSFIPEALNPDFKFDSDTHVSISFDDNGNIINDGKIIIIDNYEVSNSTKNQIKEIAGEESYEEAIKEIEERIKEARGDI
ncbi:hypothetical protein [Virgibacillus sp. YIM 98842]|uniref:hypothetical protein n=1 Tax=Virgibacillus sp. YIM 98842 TaxID=2663533 RepID=UPI0013D9D938|nr:hypothetical protein [Virgibacillus sp. YIM 98842]